jgi:hypothetical protein
MKGSVINAPPTEPTRKSPRMRFRMRTAIVAIALCALALALLDLWLRAPYRAEQHAAAALQRRGGKIVMVDSAPRWLRNYVRSDFLNMNVAAIIHLSQSRVRDEDLIHLHAFQHFGVLDLSDTKISQAGLKHLRSVIAYRTVDLSRTGVTDTTSLYGKSALEYPSVLKLSGNHILRIFPSVPTWNPIQELDLSQTNADDNLLASLPIGLVNLRNLDLSGTRVTDRGLDSLKHLDGLMILNLTNTKVTPAAVDRLHAGWPGRNALKIVTGPMKAAGAGPASAGSPK